MYKMMKDYIRMHASNFKKKNFGSKKKEAKILEAKFFTQIKR